MHPERSKSSFPLPSIVSLAATAPPCRVLIVDDDPQAVVGITTQLEASGYEVHSAGSGEEAMRVLDAKACQILITDWQMPGMDGIALCRNLRLRQGGYVYILMLTVRDGSDDVLAGLAAGADDYVVKGARPEEILARVETGRRIAHLNLALDASRQDNERISITDSLTGAWNRAYLMKYLPRELIRSQRYNHPLAVIACEVENFAWIKNGYVHAAGDEVLRSFVRRTGKCIQQGIDWLARVTGGEFVLVLPETNMEGALAVARRLHEILSAHPASTSAGRVEIRASLGVTALESGEELKSGSTAELLLAAARELHLGRQLRGEQAATEREVHLRAQCD